MEYTNYQSNPDANTGLKKKIILGSIVALALLVIFILSGYSRIAIQVENSSASGETNYILTDAEGKETKGKFIGASKTITIRKGTYHVAVKQTDKNFVKFLNSKGFFGTSTVAASLKGEASRKYVGTAPDPCMYYVNNALLSGNCGSAYETLKVHLPANDTTPPLTGLVSAFELFGPLEGFAYTKQGAVALTQLTGSEDDERGHYAGVLASSLEASDRTKLQGMDLDTIYSIKSYKDGFVAFGTNTVDFQYFTDIKAKPTKIEFAPPKDDKLVPYFTNISSDGAVVAYMDKDVDGIVVENDAPSTKFTSHVSIRSDSTQKQKSFTLDYRIDNALFCGTERLCVVNFEKGMHVYDVGGRKPSLLFTVGGVQGLDETSRGTLVVTKTDVLILDMDSQEGYSEFSLGDYSYCGHAVTGSGDLVCIKKGNLANSAILLDPSNKANDNIDKSISKLLSNPGVSYASVYENYIYVVPNYGVAQYNAELGGDSYSAEQMASVNGSINKTLAELGLDKPPYKVINTGL